MSFYNTRLSFSIPTSDHTNLTALCKRKGIHMKDFMHALIMREIEKDKKKKDSNPKK